MFKFLIDDNRDSIGHPYLPGFFSGKPIFSILFGLYFVSLYSFLLISFLMSISISFHLNIKDILVHEDLDISCPSEEFTQDSRDNATILLAY